MSGSVPFKVVAEECFGFERHKLLPFGTWINENGRVNSLGLQAENPLAGQILQICRN